MRRFAVHIVLLLLVITAAFVAWHALMQAGIPGLLVMAGFALAALTLLMVGHAVIRFALLLVGHVVARLALLLVGHVVARLAVTTLRALLPSVFRPWRSSGTYENPMRRR